VIVAGTSGHRPSAPRWTGRGLPDPSPADAPLPRGPDALSVRLAEAPTVRGPEAPPAHGPGAPAGPLPPCGRVPGLTDPARSADCGPRGRPPWGRPPWPSGRDCRPGRSRSLPHSSLVRASPGAALPGVPRYPRSPALRSPRYPRSPGPCSPPASPGQRPRPLSERPPLTGRLPLAGRLPGVERLPGAERAAPAGRLPGTERLPLAGPPPLARPPVFPALPGRPRPLSGRPLPPERPPPGPPPERPPLRGCFVPVPSVLRAGGGVTPRRSAPSLRGRPPCPVLPPLDPDMRFPPAARPPVDSPSRRPRPFPTTANSYHARSQTGATNLDVPHTP
jgi:hypothetical protein